MTKGKLKEIKGKAEGKLDTVACGSLEGKGYLIIFSFFFFFLKNWVNAFTILVWSYTPPTYKKALCHSDMLNMKEFSCVVINLGPDMEFQA